MAITRIWSDWVAGVRWGRNQILDTQATTDHRMNLSRIVDGAESGWVVVNETTDQALIAAVRRAERLAAMNRQELNADLLEYKPLESSVAPSLFDNATFHLDGTQRMATAAQLIQQAETAGMHSAGYLEVSAHSMAILDTKGRSRYFQYTWAQCSVTVRDPQGTGSGWAGVDWPAWSKIDAVQLGKIALDKCVRSSKPERVEPGRYTTILEPQAVFDLVRTVFGEAAMGRVLNESNPGAAPFWKKDEQSRLGERVTDARLTISADPMDPELSFPPFQLYENPENDYPMYHPITFVKDGVLTELGYNRRYAAENFGAANGRPVPGAFRMSGGETTIEEMVASTPRGILVTRFDNVLPLVPKSTLVRAYTRDGTWLIENGKVSKPVINLAATEAVLFMLNNIEQLGVPRRIFNPPFTWAQGFAPAIPRPAIVPPLKVRDFSFTALIDAV
jgi:predicted Zn-dependent protease